MPRPHPINHLRAWWTDPQGRLAYCGLWREAKRLRGQFIPEPQDGLPQTLYSASQPATTPTHGE